jgi:hypothetical protein
VTASVVTASVVALAMGRARCWAGLCVAVLALAACAGDPDDSGATVPTSAPLTVVTDALVDASTTTSGASAARPAVVVDVVNQPGSGDFEGAVGDVDGQTCAVAGGRWTSAGSLRNPTDAVVDYRVYVSFLDRAGETLALIERDLDHVMAGDSQAWSVVFDTSVADVRCVLRVERRVAG